MDGSAFVPAFDALMVALTGSSAPPPALYGRPGSLPSRLPVEDAAAATAGAALTAAAGLRGRPQLVGLDRDHVAAAFRSEAHVRLDGAGLGDGFAPLSRFWPVVDGWVRTHANYAWHRSALLAALGIADAAGDPDSVGAQLATMPAAEVEETVYANGGIAVAVQPERPMSLRD